MDHSEKNRGDSEPKPNVAILGQTPPPWHGQAVATQILFDHDWPEFDVECLRMDYSDDMDEVGRFQIKKMFRLFRLIAATRRSLSRDSKSILLYPPASAKWIPFLRDAIFLASVRGKAAKTVFIFHASGLAQFSKKNSFTRWLADIAYGDADMALEVAEEKVSPHETFGAKKHTWCPCGIEAPPVNRTPKVAGSPIRALFVGSLQEGKGVLEILKTADALRRAGHADDFHFDVVGRWMDTDFENEAKALHRKLGLGDMVGFPGQLTGEEKWDAYRNTDVFFFPTHYPSEASPLVLMEALSAGLPIITTAWNGIPALMEGCPTAELLPVKSPEAYAEALVRLRDGNADTESTTRESRKFYEDNFLPERFVERVTSALRSVALDLRTPSPGTGVHRQLKLSVYLADQNPGHDRSMGISRMSQAVLNEISGRDDVSLHVLTSLSSQQGPQNGSKSTVLPWRTRGKLIRIATDHLHPHLSICKAPADVWYYPKGFLPRFGSPSAPTAVTVHDTIIQHYWDNYPGWRRKSEYNYWAKMLMHTLQKADAVFTVSENAKSQIETFMERHNLRKKEILVTYEPCIYEDYPQPENLEKSSYVLHLASREPHKRTADLIGWWAQRAQADDSLPKLVLIGKIPNSATHYLHDCDRIELHPFLEDAEFRAMISGARALILPSEIEGFGLPAIEAYYLGTPVCYSLGTSVQEILETSTTVGGFHLDRPDSLWPALEDALGMKSCEIRRIGLDLRKKYASEKVVGRIIEGLREVAKRKRQLSLDRSASRAEFLDPGQ